MSRPSHLFFIAMFLRIGLGTCPLPAEEPFTTSENVENAALVYWQAFAVLPVLSWEDDKLLSQLEKGEKPISDARPLLSGSALVSLELTRTVAPDTPCRWGVIENGPLTLLPHLSKARLLARLLVLQARFDAETGSHAAAVENLTRALLVARNVDEGGLVQALVGGAIEATIVVDAAQAMLPKLDRSLRDRFARSLVKLPPRTTVAQAMSYERDLAANWLRTVMTADLATARTIWQEAGYDDDSRDFETMRAGTMQEQLQRLEGLVAQYDRIIEATRLPRAEAQQEFKQLEASISNSSNPLIRPLIPEVEAAYQRHAEFAARFAEFGAVLRARSTSTSN